MQMRRPASVVIFLLFAVGTIRSVRISWLGQEKDENKRSTILHHTYRPESPAGFSFLINAQISGRIAPDINQTNESLWLKFDIEDVFNITTTILNMTVLNSSSTEQYLAWTTVGTNQSLNRSIIHIDSDSLLMRAQFKPANFGPENDEINTKGVMSTDQSQPWELMLLFHISGDCGSWLWGYWGGCSNHFFLDAYGMKANLVEERQNASTNGTEYVNQVFVWTSSYLGDKIWDNDRNKMKTGFQCSDTTLDFSQGHNNETLSIETPSGAELTFAELKIAAFLDMEKEPHSFSRLFSFNKCAQDEFHWPWWMEVLGDSIRRNLDKYIFGAILLIILFAMLKKYRRDRERKMLGTHFGYNNMTGPFSLEEFDEVDVITPLDIRKKRGSQRMIY